MAAPTKPPGLPDSAPARSWPAPRPLVLLAALAAALAGSALFFRDPSATPALFPPCFWQVATGTYCPGCGITRALHALLHGRVLAALGYNAVGLLVLLITATLLLRPAWLALRENRWAPPVLPHHTARWLVVVGVLWAVLRNLPWAPFTALAPSP